MQKFSQKFVVRSRGYGLAGIFHWFREVFTGKQPLEEVEVVFLYDGDVEPEVILSGLYILHYKSIEKKIEDF